MKLSDYIVTFLQKKGICHFFGYQGTMIAHVVDSIERNPETENHSAIMNRERLLQHVVMRRRNRNVHAPMRPADREQSIF